MFEIFGADTPLALRFFIAFLVVLVLIGLTAWVVRRFGADRFGGAAARGRAPRLAVIDAAAVDSRRRLIIIRRDNVEHLLMIGGPSDVVVETNIVRSAAATQREASVTRGTDNLPRAVPLPDGSWQPEQGQDTPAWPPAGTGPAPVRPSPRSADAIANLAAEFSVRPAAPADLDHAPSAPASPRMPAEQMRTPPLAPDTAPGDQNLIEMAQRLEQALRRPGTQNAPRAPEPAKPKPEAATAAPAARPAQPAPARPAAAEQKPAPAPSEGRPVQTKQMYDSLEQEMASLLGRPKNKT